MDLLLMLPIITLNMLRIPAKMAPQNPIQDRPGTFQSYLNLTILQAKLRCG